MPLRIAIACGGTGGHIFPGLATARALRLRGHDVTLWMAGRKDIEGEALREWDGPAVTVSSQGFPSGISVRSIGAGWKMLRAGLQCRKLMKRERPDIVLGMGSYSSVGPILGALMLRIPFVLHEANVVPGKAVRLFARSAAAVAASFEESRYYLKRDNIAVTGMPLRDELIEAGRNAERSQHAGAPLTIAVMGGSRGARAINEAIPAALGRVSALGTDLRVIHLAGSEGREQVERAYEEAGMEADVRAFEHNMASIYMEADLIICRSGAATCAEILYFHVPALLIPYPYAAGDHQMANARALEMKGRADVVAEDEMSEDWLVEYLCRCVAHPERLAKMRAHGDEKSMPLAAEMLADLIEKTAL